MGAKTSKSELTRRKSFSSFGRSSQRSLFQKSKAKLNRISKQIDAAAAAESADVATLERIKGELEGVEKELGDISEAVKAKNQEKYDEVYEHVKNTRKKYEDKFNVQPGLEEPEESHEILLRNVGNSEELPNVRFTESMSESISYSPEPRKPSVKFGVQVLPPSPQASQVLLKRKTYPTNSSPRNEILNRNTADGAIPQMQNGSFAKVTATTNSFHTTGEAEITSILKETTAITKNDYIKTNLILGIETINDKVNELENKLKYFTGSKESRKYIDLHEGLINNLAFLDGIDAEEDSIAKQEKKILKQRINELLKILECLVEQINYDCKDNLAASESQDRPKLYSVSAI